MRFQVEEGAGASGSSRGEVAIISAGICGAKVGVSSRGIGGSGHGYNSLLKPAGGSAQSQQIDFHHARFQFLMAT